MVVILLLLYYISCVFISTLLVLASSIFLVGSVEPRHMTTSHDPFIYKLGAICLQGL